MFTTFITPEIAIVNDNVYSGIIPIGTAAGTDTLIREFKIPTRCIGKIYLIENQSSEVNNILTYSTLNDMIIPAQFSLGERTHTKENRPYSMSQYISGEEKIRVWARNGNLAAANLNVYVRLAFWYFDVSIVKSNEYLNKYYQEIINAYKLHKGIIGDII